MIIQLGMDTRISTPGSKQDQVRLFWGRNQSFAQCENLQGWRLHTIPGLPVTYYCSLVKKFLLIPNLKLSYYNL